MLVSIELRGERSFINGFSGQEQRYEGEEGGGGAMKEGRTRGGGAVEERRGGETQGRR